jgi:excisionase family DNA binding protein
MSSTIEVERKCEYCGNWFTAKALYTRYCSKTCNSRDYKNKIRENRIAVSVQNKSAMTIALEQRHLSPLLQKVYLSINETAQYTGVSKRTIERMISNGKLQVVRFQRRVVLSRITIDELLKNA